MYKSMSASQDDASYFILKKMAAPPTLSIRGSCWQEFWTHANMQVGQHDAVVILPLKSVFFDAVRLTKIRENLRKTL
jgi:hypothetical protein